LMLRACAAWEFEVKSSNALPAGAVAMEKAPWASVVVLWPAPVTVTPEAGAPLLESTARPLIAGGGPAGPVDDEPPPPPPPPPPPVVVNATLSSSYKAFKTFTRYTRLTLKRVPRGAKVTVTCKGKRCPSRRFTSTRSGSVKLTKFVKKKLRPGTTLTIRVTKPGALGKQFVIKIRKGARPKLTIRQLT
jgi:hypothetical protein